MRTGSRQRRGSSGGSLLTGGPSVVLVSPRTRQLVSITAAQASQLQAALDRK